MNGSNLNIRLQWIPVREESAAVWLLERREKMGGVEGVVRKEQEEVGWEDDRLFGSVVLFNLIYTRIFSWCTSQD